MTEFKVTDPKKSLDLTKWVVRALVGLIGGGLLYWLLPYGVSIAENAFQMTIALSKTLAVGIPVAFGLILLSDNWTKIGAWREMLSAKLWEKLVRKNPMHFIRKVIERFQEALEKFRAAYTTLMKIVTKLQDKGQEQLEEKEKYLQRAMYHDEQGEERKAALAITKANAAETRAKNYYGQASDIQASAELMDELSSFIEEDINYMEIDYENMVINLEIADAKDAATNAVNSAMSGTKEQRLQKELARRAYEERINNAKASFDTLLKNVEPMLEAGRIQDSIDTKKGLAALQEYKKNRNKDGSIREQIERLKQRNPELYTKSGNVDTQKYRRNSNSGKVRRRKTNSSTFGELD